MRIISILLLIVGIIGILLGNMMVGDIGIAAIIGSITACLSGIGFFLVSKNKK